MHAADNDCPQPRHILGHTELTVKYTCFLCPKLQVVADFPSNTMLGGLAPTTLVGSRVSPSSEQLESSCYSCCIVEVVLHTWNEESEEFS